MKPAGYVATRLMSLVASAAGSHSIRTVDAMPCGMPERVAMYMLASRPVATAPPAVAFVDNNTSAAVPRLLAALDEVGATPDDVKYIIVTHAHLDHAAGTGTLLEHCRAATVLCHPRAKRHLVDPKALIDSARRVYSPEEFAAQVGDMIPCAADRVRAVADGETFDLAEGRPLRFIHTEGHAKHHCIIHDPTTSSVFTGDNFGVSYDDAAAYGLAPGTLLPTTSPIDFDYTAAAAAVRVIEDLPVLRAWPTHFGPVEDVADGAAQLRPLLARMESLRRRMSLSLQAGDAPETVLAAGEAAVLRIYKETFAARGLRDDVPASFWTERMGPEVTVNTLGLLVAAQRHPVSAEGNLSKL